MCQFRVHLNLIESFSSLIPTHELIVMILKLPITNDSAKELNLIILVMNAQCNEGLPTKK